MKDWKYGFIQEYPRRSPFAQGVVPLTGVPVRASDHGVELSGRILFAWRRDILVVIDSPVSGLVKGLHIPHFDPRIYNVFVSWRGGPSYELTRKGWDTARCLLVELYRSSCEHEQAPG